VPTEGDSLDAEAVHSFLEGALGTDVESVAFLARGEWSRCFSFSVGGSDQVIRFGNHLEDFEKDHRAYAYTGPSLPIPRVTETGEAFGGFYAISQRVIGTPINELDHAGWRTILLLAITESRVL